MQSRNLSDLKVDFPDLPPFPTDIPTAPLLRLSLGKLLAGKTTEINRLFTASVEIGFFYLDFQDCQLGSSALEDADKLFGVGKELFELSLEEKQKYDFSEQNSYFGYKGQGAAYVDKEGNLDRNEFYNISKDDIFGLSDQIPAPELLHRNRKLIESFMRSSHSIVTLILSILNTKLGLPPNTLPNMHRQNAISGDQVRWVKAPPQPINDRRVALGQHTDFGSVTVLFNRLGGLQVQMPGTDDWVYVRPLPGHAIINLGDAMVKFSNGLLRSNIHRVIAPPGAQAECTRYSLVYFARPEDDVVLRRLEGNAIPPLEGVEEEVSSKQWILRRALGKRINLGQVDFEKSAGTEEISRRK
ncbi:Oxoglutarate/iron-dependent dioxygenase [Penicillium odoratum]|uniref:Oxoglutarate/iron-dependent dioxygenase n=1 Tax=Penicillium odoratum TaxID=1167516 RepID=UPI0025494BEE|nr:Oxoglutarate/iron-dependent dioxygenase [Penicillium odoratum]KAJ5761174.1 Oxoglutarate/iron-dependent dioxygenase [Penicillium odoratum]